MVEKNRKEKIITITIYYHIIFIIVVKNQSVPESLEAARILVILPTLYQINTQFTDRQNHFYYVLLILFFHIYVITISIKYFVFLFNFRYIVMSELYLRRNCIVL